MPTRHLVLASASPARLRLLRDAGFDPSVMVSGVDEDAVEHASTHELVEALAVRKAVAVAEQLKASDAVVLGCDSLLALGGQTLGKPGSPEAARHRWQHMRGNRGSLLTGHCVIDTTTGRRASAVAETLVHFGNPDDDELDAYIGTGEPMRVAGAFTLDGFGASFIDRIEGDHGNVIGLSLPTLRRLLAKLDIRITDLWR